FNRAQSQESYLIGYYNLEDIIQAMPERSIADAKLEKHAQKLKEQIDALQVEFNKKIEDYTKNKNSYTDATRELKEKEIFEFEQKAREFQETAQQDYLRLLNELYSPIYMKVDNATKAVKQKYNFIYVFDKNKVTVVNEETTNDLTELIKYELKIASTKPSFKAKYSVDKKIRTIGSDNIVKVQAEYTEALRKLDSKKSMLMNQLEKSQAEYAEKYKEYDKNKYNYSNAIREQKENELMDLNQRIQESIKAADLDFFTLRDELLKPIYLKVKDLLVEYAVSKSYPLIIDSAIVKDHFNYSEFKNDIILIDENFIAHLNSSPNYFIKNYVEHGINEWQQKGEFEKITDYQKRVNEQTRKIKVQQLTDEALKSFKQEYSKGIDWKELTLTPYDSENETYLIVSPKVGQFAVSVPIAEAQMLKQNWASVKFENQDYYISNDSLTLAKVTIKNPVNGKSYTYDSKQATTYMANNITYNFSPIEVDIPKNEKVVSNTKVESKDIIVGKDPIDINIPLTKVVNDKTFALVIGNENYKNEIQVSFAQNDAKVFSEYCKKTLGIPSNNVHLLLNGSYGEMLGELKWIYDIIEAYKGQARVIFYYAGHGMPDENDKSAYILPTDGNSTMPQTALKVDDIYKKLNANPSQGVFVFLDACFSGAAREGSLAQGRGVKVRPKTNMLTGNCVVFSATSNEETAHPLKEKNHGLFTYYLLKKLNESKGDITLSELSNYIVDVVKKQSLIVNGKAQNPVVNTSPDISNSWQSLKLK
ncbi:MAG TPA: OmpH family outer membrane protein, partial [Tenuifilaceae bacterium]|nr:OmpH family outer membrane protein [Tenuifilaceae bacterium]